MNAVKVGVNIGSFRGGGNGENRLAELNGEISEQRRMVQAFVETSYLNADICKQWRLRRSGSSGLARVFDYHLYC